MVKPEFARKKSKKEQVERRRSVDGKGRTLKHKGKEQLEKIGLRNRIMMIFSNQP